MAISWGAWEYSGGNGMRVGIDVSWTANNGDANISNDTQAAKATIKVYTENQYSYSNDSQTLSYGGAIGGSQGFSNSSSGGSVLRDTVTYTYYYGANEYGSSPGSRTFSASLSGAYNGVTPSKSVTSDIPLRPTAAPAPPSSVTLTRISDTAMKISWANNSTSAAPWDNGVEVQRDDGANDVWNGTVGSPSGASTYFTDNGAHSNYLYKYRVRALGKVGNSAFVETGIAYTTPDAPTNVTRTPVSGSSAQTVSWTVNAPTSLGSYQNEVWVNRAGAWSLLATVSGTTTSYTDNAANAAQVTYYRVRTITAGGNQGTLYSAYSDNTTATVGTTSPPAAPTNLAPNSNALISPNLAKVFTWDYNSTDTTAQTYYQIQWRVVGGASWTLLAQTASSAQSWTAPANTFPDNSNIEWQVRTWGTNATAGAWSASATFKTVGDPNASLAQKRLMRLDLDTGRQETAPVGVLPPVGSIMMFASETAPPGWLFCQGLSLSRASYPNLFAVIGTAFGSVDANSFTLPDFRDRFPIGRWSYALGTLGGSAYISASNMPSHTHSLTSDSHNHTIKVEWAADVATTGSVRRVFDVGDATGGSGGSSANAATSTDSHTHTVGATGSGTAYYQPFTAVNFIIKY